MSHRPATERQIAFIKTLVSERTLAPEDQPTLDKARSLAVAGALTTRQASALIDLLQQAPHREQAAVAPAEPAPEGMHEVDGTVYKVQVSRDGRPYAKVLAQDEDGAWHFEYAAGAVRRLSESTRMPAESAARFGALYGVCCACGRALSDETSIHYGYGPICADRNGWDYSRVAVAV